MPLFNKKQIFEHTTLAIWKIEEADAYFLDLLDLQAEEIAEFSKISGNRRTEWLSARILLSEISTLDGRDYISKDEHGKPHLTLGDQHISISHSFDYSAIISSDLSIGIDVQKELDKIRRIKHKFLHLDELNSIPPEHEVAYLHFFWGAKESMYKAYGKKKLQFSTQILIEPFTIEANKMLCKGKILVENKVFNYTIQGEQFDDYYLVYAYEV